MRIELRVCQHCLDGEHGASDHKTAVLDDMVRCAERIQEYKDVIDLDEVHIKKVVDDEPGKPEAIPVVAATIQNDQIVLNDTQLVTEDDNGTKLVYVNPVDVLKVLSRNVDELTKEAGEDVAVELSPESAQALTQSGTPN